MDNKVGKELISSSRECALTQLAFRGQASKRKKKRQRPHKQFAEEKHRNGPQNLLKIY